MKMLENDRVSPSYCRGTDLRGTAHSARLKREAPDKALNEPESSACYEPGKQVRATCSQIIIFL